MKEDDRYSWKYVKIMWSPQYMNIFCGHKLVIRNYDGMMQVIARWVNNIQWSHLVWQLRAGQTC